MLRAVRWVGVIIGLLVSFVATLVEGAPLSFVGTGEAMYALAGRGVALADFNGDGRIDAFVAADDTAEEHGNRVYFGDGRGRFTTGNQVLDHTSPFTHRPAVADIDGNGSLDVVVSGNVWLNNGQGQFVAKDDRIVGGKLEMTAVGLADLNGDGHPDLVAIERWAAVRVYLNDGRGYFQDSGQRLNLGTSAGSPILGNLALADLDGNGTIDLVTTGWRNRATDACPNRVWLNDGKGNFQDSQQPFDEGRRHVHGIAVGDLDGDGRPDIALALTSTGEAGKIYLNVGHGRFRSTGQKLGDRWAHAVALGDFDGNGTLDLFFACGDPKTGTPNEVWLNDGEARFTDSKLRLAHAFSWDVALGDLDGDGRTDAFVADLRLVDDSKVPPVFGGTPPEIWLNRTPSAASR